MLFKRWHRWRSVNGFDNDIYPAAYFVLLRHHWFEWQGKVEAAPRPRCAKARMLKPFSNQTIDRAITDLVIYWVCSMFLWMWINLDFTFYWQHACIYVCWWCLALTCVIPIIYCVHFKDWEKSIVVFIRSFKGMIQNNKMRLKGPVGSNFSNLQRLLFGRFKIGKYTFPSQFANIFVTYQTLVTNLHLLRVELRCKLPGKLHRVTGPLAHHVVLKHIYTFDNKYYNAFFIFLNFLNKWKYKLM